MNRNQFRQKLTGKFPENEIAQIMYAYDLSKAAHRNQEREEFPADAPIKDKRYFNHPRQLAIDMIDAGVVDCNDICIALLHDCPEDTSIFGNQKIDGYNWAMTDAMYRLTKSFNKIVAESVIALTIPTVSKSDEEFLTKTKCTIFGHNKLLEAPTRALLVKLFDRLHNLSSIEVKKVETARLKLVETATFYIPLFYKKFNASFDNNTKRIGLQKTKNLEELVATKTTLIG
jgi:(p)ppGpp synthase/HD superfamily hydrolase